MTIEHRDGLAAFCRLGKIDETGPLVFEYNEHISPAVSQGDGWFVLASQIFPLIEPRCLMEGKQLKRIKKYVSQEVSRYPAGPIRLRKKVTYREEGGLRQWST